MGILQDWEKKIGKTWNKVTGGGARRRAGEYSQLQQQLLEQLVNPELQDFNGNIPELEQLGAQGNLSQQGVLEALAENANTLDDNAYNNLDLDPQTRQAQLEALGKLTEYSRSGVTANDKKALQQMLDKSRADDRGRRLAIDAQMQRRGMAGSGMDLASKLASQQAASDLQAREALGIAANRETNQMNATSMLGNLSSGIRSQDYQQASDQASAQNLLNQFNATMRQGIEQRNTERQMGVNRQNLSEQQRIADYNANRTDRNTQLTNANRLSRYELQRRANQDRNALSQQRASNRNANLRSRAGLYGDRANYNRQDSQASQQRAGEMIGSLINAGVAAAGASSGGSPSKPPKKGGA